MFPSPYLDPYYFYLYKYANDSQPKTDNKNNQLTWPARQIDWLADQISAAYDWAKQNPLKTMGIGIGAASTGYALYSLIKALRKKSGR